MGRNYYTKIYPDRQCETCGRTFSPKQWNSKYCSQGCKLEKQYQDYQSNKISAVYTLTCKTCGKSFEATRQNTLYCCSKCRDYKPQKKPETKQNRRFVYTKSICPNPKCNWRLDCGGGKSVCLRAKCDNGVVFS